MPQAWETNWLLPDGSRGLDDRELFDASESDPRANASRKRSVMVQTLGNMTLLSSALNSAQSNLGWEQKRPEMVKHSLLPINQDVLSSPTWNEETILKRGTDLFDRALKVWER